MCGGHGRCVCGRCECAPGWMGDSCSCRDSPEQCVPPHLLTNHYSAPADLCSGHGRCECGECVCEDGWIGAHCDSCPTCGDICDHLKQCVECRVWGTGDIMRSADVRDHPRVCFDECEKEFTFRYESDVSKYAGEYIETVRSSLNTLVKR